MRSANYTNMTTTSIAGSSGDGAVTMTALSSRPAFSTVFGSGARVVRYVIEDTVNYKFETGIGSVASDVLTRTRPQVTWDGTTYKDGNSAVSAIQFGGSPTSGNVIIRISATAEAQGAVNLHSYNTTATTGQDANWSAYKLSGTSAVSGSGTASALTAGRETFLAYCLTSAGLLTGVSYNVAAFTSAVNLKWALFDVASTGLPGEKIVTFVTQAIASTGQKTDTATASWSPTGGVYLTPGWYYIGLLADANTCTFQTYPNISNTGHSFLPTPPGKGSGYGWSQGCWVAGSYASGLTANPSITNVFASSNEAGNIKVGLRVIP